MDRSGLTSTIFYSKKATNDQALLKINKNTSRNSENNTKSLKSDHFSNLNENIRIDRLAFSNNLIDKNVHQHELHNLQRSQTININTNYNQSFFKIKNQKHKIIHINKHLFSSLQLQTRQTNPLKVENYFMADINIKNEINYKLSTLNREPPTNVLNIPEFIINDYKSEIELNNEKVSINDLLQRDIDRFKDLGSKKYVEKIMEEIRRKKFPNLKKKIIHSTSKISSNTLRNYQKKSNNVQTSRKDADYYLEAKSPLFQINSDLCFPYIIKDQKLLFNLWNENIEKLKNKNKYFAQSASKMGVKNYKI